MIGTAVCTNLPFASMQSHLPLRQTHAQHFTRLCTAYGGASIVRTRRSSCVARRHVAKVHDRSPVRRRGTPLWQALKGRCPTQRQFNHDLDGRVVVQVGRDRPRCTPHVRDSNTQQQLPVIAPARRESDSDILLCAGAKPAGSTTRME